jgi:hypothetical protein
MQAEAVEEVAVRIAERIFSGEEDRGADPTNSGEQAFTPPAGGTGLPTILPIVVECGETKTAFGNDSRRWTW